ncbi:hypothetical protein GGS23DRAFT_589089 [Durotheca rogersii]|uniref:uncharacterized protein n=1 Tax=Durotheca rogersii TaxID=419775 RepID=UPI0022209F53|nr:uncharacterized protein GGS23DRAFT_589089 [Durotheca rogersii]KAI5856222.1 hypothetical protein GGS23DRAFT_589089 [Durotheca rogersii]
MPEHLHTSGQNALRLFSRSPHPYHRPSSQLLDPSSHLYGSLDNHHNARLAAHGASREVTPSSDSGTEADDEHFLRGLPAPRRLHKGLRGRNEVVSGASTPLPSPAILEEEGQRLPLNPTREAHSGPKLRGPDTLRRRKEIIRRVIELLVVGFLGLTVHDNIRAQLMIRRRHRELCVCGGVYAVLVLLYPLRLVMWAYWHRTPTRKIAVSIPVSFDTAPLLYPPAITMLVSLLLAVDNEAVFLPNIILTICSLPPSLVPTITLDDGGCDPLHWALSCTPLLVDTGSRQPIFGRADLGGGESSRTNISLETTMLLYPLHHSLCSVLRTLTTTSLLTAELQLLSISLINLMLFSSSPQAIILNSLLWVGGLDILVSCSQVINWGISLARVPKWRFKRTPGSLKATSALFSAALPWKKKERGLRYTPADGSPGRACAPIDDLQQSDDLEITTLGGSGNINASGTRDAATTKTLKSSQRHTLLGVTKAPPKSYTHTPSGRRRRTTPDSVRVFFSLTQKQAAARKWSYALYVYTCVAGAVLLPIPFIGVKRAIMDEALHGREPIGWALGYLLGDLQWFRWEVVSRNLEGWICLPSRPVEPGYLRGTGWVDHLRRLYLGEANTRLALSGYFLSIIVTGLIVVFQLSQIYEVDTRRKVFHFMMVAMFLPATYIDPAFAALALSGALAFFLLLDLLRASQLPPVSKPLASFLAPYVDGRDLRGPVVISHIFLLIGCAIPLWLSLGSIPRTGVGCLEGWDVPTREVGMVSGVICVGLGDAAASLIGRRYGRRKWLWGGGKSLEGSIAFACAVFLGLAVARVWLHIGGWPPSNGVSDAPVAAAPKMGVCAVTASLTEAVLTGGNDNVIVPVALWICLKSLGI